MKRIHGVSLGLVAAAVSAGLVYAALWQARVAEPSAVTVHGLTARRLWATTTMALAIVSAVLACWGWLRPTSRFGTARGRRATMVLGSIAVLSGGLVLAVANAGPGSGNGVVGGAAALVLGAFAVGLAGLAVRRANIAGTARVRSPGVMSRS